MGGLGLEQGRVQQVGDDAGVVQRAGLQTFVEGLAAIEELEHAGDGAADRRADAADALDALARRQHLARQVERHEHDGRAALEHHMGGMRIGVDVELGGRPCCCRRWGRRRP